MNAPPPYEKPLAGAPPAVNMAAPGPAPPGQPIKQYEVFRPSAWSPGTQEIRFNGHTVLHSQRERHMFRQPDLHLIQAGGGLVAVASLQSFTRDQAICLTPPGSRAVPEKESRLWVPLECDGFMSNKWGFRYGGRMFAWKRTHNKALGASSWGSRDFKLVDQSNEQVLVVYRYNSAMFKSGRMAEIDYYVELGQELELLSLVAILGIELHIQQQKNNAAASSGGGGGG